MKRRRPSGPLLAGMMVLILALAAVFFHGGAATDSSETGDRQERANKRFGPARDAPAQPNGSGRPKRIGRIEKLISEYFPEERDLEFNNGPGDLAEAYRTEGLTDFCGQMRKALRRDEDALAEIFTTYWAEPESYGSFINILIENLGDDFFFHQIQKQPEDTQSLILGQIWVEIYRFPLDYQSDGSIPAADSGLYYPKCGELFLVLLEKKLQSDHWQRLKRIRSEQGAGE